MTHSRQDRNMLPENIGFGRVRMRVLLGVPDSPDDDDEFPKAQAASGTVRFTPSVARVVNVTGPEPVTLGMANITGTLNDEGYLCGPDGVPGLYLIATDDEDNQPVNWTYRVAFSVTGVPMPNIDISVPEGSDTDLTLISPVPSSPGVGVNQWENLVLRAEAAASRAHEAVYTLVVGDQVYTPDEDGRITLSIEGGGGVTSWDDLEDKPFDFPPAAHDHAVGEIDGLQDALDQKQDAGNYATAGQLATKADEDHSHGIGDVEGLSSALDNKQDSGDYATAQALATGLAQRADLDHDHVVGEVQGLQTALDGKADTAALTGYLRTQDPDIVLLGAGDTPPDPSDLPDKYLWLVPAEPAE